MHIFHLFILTCSLLCTAPFLCAATSDDWAHTILTSLTTRQKIGQLFVVATASCFEQPTEALATSLFKCPYKMAPDYVKQLITDYHVGGIIFLYKSTPELQIAATNEYQALSTIPLLIAQDCEWGLSMRLQNTLEFPKNNQLGIIKNRQLIYEMGKEIGRQCKALGLHMNCSPVVDVCNNPNNTLLQKRSFGADPSVISECGQLMMQGLQDAGIIACAKHFPGHGDTDIDSHASLPRISHDYEHLQRVELAPFKALIDGGVRAVMLGHLAVPALEPAAHLPATFSYAITTELLENTLHFTGLKVTDGLGMGALTEHYEPGTIELEAFLAGNDILLCPLDVPRAVILIEQALESGRISHAELDRRVLKILQAKKWAECHKFKPINSEDACIQLHTPEGKNLLKKLMEQVCTI
jgi:beta-N-acetylhexosaminidase